MIKGNDCTLTFLLGDTYEQVYCGKSFAILTESEILETTTKGDGQYLDYDYHALTYSVEIEGVIRIPDAHNAFDVLLAQRAFADVPFLMEFRDEKNPGLVKVIEGRTFVTSSALGAVSSQLADHSLSFRGRGPYDLRDTVEPCPGILLAEDVTITVNPITHVVFVELDYSGPDATFNYSVDGGDVTNTAGPAFLIGAYEVGDHTITITPLCSSNSEEGTGVTIPFSV